MGKFIGTRYAGVYYKVLSSIDPHTGKPDRTYYINAPDELGCAHWVKVGRQSEGMNARLASIHKSDSRVTPRPRKEKKSFTFGEAVAAYAEWARANGKHIDPPLDQYIFHCKKHIDTTLIDSFTPEKAEALKIKLSKKSISTQTIVHALSFLKRVCNYAIGIGRASHNPFTVKKGGVFRMPRLDNSRVRFLTPEECHKILEALKKRSPQTYYMAVLSLNTGLRATEIFHLQREDIDKKSCCLFIRSKGGRREIVHAPKKIIEMLLDIPNHGSYLFPMPDGRIRKQIPATFQKVISSLGMQTPKSSHYHISFHTFRHTFASILAQSGKVDIFELKNLMRHHSIDMTMRYAHLIPSVTAEKINIISKSINLILD